MSLDTPTLLIEMERTINQTYRTMDQTYRTMDQYPTITMDQTYPTITMDQYRTMVLRLIIYGRTYTESQDRTELTDEEQTDEELTELTDEELTELTELEHLRTDLGHLRRFLDANMFGSPKYTKIPTNLFTVKDECNVCYTSTKILKCSHCVYKVCKQCSDKIQSDICVHCKKKFNDQ